MKLENASIKALETLYAVRRKGANTVRVLADKSQLPTKELKQSLLGLVDLGFVVTDGTNYSITSTGEVEYLNHANNGHAASQAR